MPHIVSYGKLMGVNKSTNEFIEKALVLCSIDQGKGKECERMCVMIQ
jgi:hypothetical protein